MSNSRPSTVSVEQFAIFGTIMTALGVGALAGNIICFRMTKRLLWNKPSLALVLNLNMSDIIVASISWVGFMFQYIAMFSEFGIDVIVYKVFWSILIALGNVTLLTLVGLAGDCFIALRWPLHYKSIATYKCVNIYIGTIWICSVLTAGSDFLAAIGRSRSSDESYADVIHNSMVFTATDRAVTEILTASVTMLTSNLLSFLCLVIMVVMYTYILLKIRRIRIDSTLSKQGGFKSEITAVRTTLMIFTSFLLLWLPTLISNIISVVEPDFLSSLSYIQMSIIGHTADSLLMVHSMVDAVIYGVRVKKTIRRHKKNRQSQAGFSRANTLRRRSNDSDKIHPDSPDEITNETSLSEQQQRRLSISSSSRVGGTTALTTISESVEVHIANTPPSDDSGINSPQKLSPQNPIKSRQANYIINPSDCYTEYTTADTDEEDELNCKNALRDLPAMCTYPEKVETTCLPETDTNSEKILEDGNINGCIEKFSSADETSGGSDLSNVTSDNHISNKSSTKDGEMLAIPKLTQPLRSSLKKNKKETQSQETEESHVRFCFPGEETRHEGRAIDFETNSDPWQERVGAGVITLVTDADMKVSIKMTKPKKSGNGKHKCTECRDNTSRSQCQSPLHQSDMEYSRESSISEGLDNRAFDSDESVTSQNNLSLTTDSAHNNGAASVHLSAMNCYGYVKKYKSSTENSYEPTNGSNEPTNGSNEPTNGSNEPTNGRKILNSCCLHNLYNVESSPRITDNPSSGSGVVAKPHCSHNSSQESWIECTKL